jgi:AraC family transcriptional activator of tynA and feaB
MRASLKRSADDLTNPFLKSESITSIAYKWGFTDSAHFSRSFKQQFELSPKDFALLIYSRRLVQRRLLIC